MKFARLGDRTAERPVLITDDATYDLTDLVASLGARDLDGEFFAAGGIAQARAAWESGALSELAAADQLRIGSPIARPSAIVCIGMNYAAHAAESGSAPPQIPIMFLKTPNTMTGPNDEVAIPRNSGKTDWEVELGVVIGRRASYLADPADALDYVAGFVLANDLSERTFQIEESGGQWSKGKCCPDFNPTGPWLVTPEEFAHSGAGLRSWVNGEPRQDSNTADMIFSVEQIIHHLSQYLALEPGDLILTGTPEGVGLSGRFEYLKPGDVVEVEIDGLGRQKTTMTAAPGEVA